MFNAAELIRDFQFPDENEHLHAVDEFPDLFIATSVTEYRMRCNASTASYGHCLVGVQHPEPNFSVLVLFSLFLTLL